MDGRDVRSWRVTGAEPRGLNVWFDPDSEYVRLFDIPHPDSDEGRRFLERVAVSGIRSYLDSVGSVSADGPGQATDAPIDDCEAPDSRQVPLPFDTSTEGYDNG